MLRLLFLLGLGVFGAALACAGLWIYLEFVPPARAAAVNEVPATVTEPEKIDLYDVDAKAAKMSFNQPYYQKLRDDLLLLYSSQHPAPSSYDNQAREVLRLAAYELTWGDGPEDGILQDLNYFEQQAEAEGCHDELICDLDYCAVYYDHYPLHDVDAASTCTRMLLAAQTKIPTALKYWELQTALMATLKCNKNAGTLQLHTPSMQLLPKVLAGWEQSLAQLIREKPTSYTIFYNGDRLFDFCKCDEDVMALVKAAIDQAYAEAGQESGTHVALDGDYFISSAWAARGNGYGNTVSDQQQKLMGERLAQAQQILEDGYVKFPDEPQVSNLMITVCMGEGLDRPTMETWFQRSVKANPNDSTPYYRKIYYLQPRWYGTEDDILKFGQECVATQKWEAGIPLVFTYGLSMVADNGDAEVFAHAEVWDQVESVYRKILQIHPRSTNTRTYFLQAAYLGHHRDVALEQYKILGKNWDPSVLDDDDYKNITTYLGQ